MQELRKMESRKKDREKKAQDLQKLITAADTNTEMRRAERKATKKKLPLKREMEKPVYKHSHSPNRLIRNLMPTCLFVLSLCSPLYCLPVCPQQTVPETAGIKFPDFKSAGVTLRSQRVSMAMH